MSSQLPDPQVPLPHGRAVNALSRMIPDQLKPRNGYIIAVAGHTVIGAVLLVLRDQTTPISKGFGLMAVVIVAAAAGGMGPGVLASLIGFGIFNFAFIPPYGSFSIAKAEDTIVLFVFLGLSLLISTLLALENERRVTAEAREREVELLHRLSRQLVATLPGPAAYEASLEHLVDIFGFRAASLFVPQGEGLKVRTTVGSPSGMPAANWDPGAGPAPLRIPLSVGSRNLGLVVLEGERPPVESAELRIIRAFCNELALVLERDRLLEVAEDADVLRRTEHVRRALLDAVSHELRSPLAAIKASVTDLLTDDAPSSVEYHREVLEAVNEETDRLDSLITTCSTCPESRPEISRPGCKPPTWQKRSAVPQIGRNKSGRRQQS